MDSIEKRYLQKAAGLCVKQERCISEIKQKLFGWKVPVHLQEEIIEYLIQEKFIDESRFSESYAKDKFRYNKWGKAKIAFQLKQKGIDGNVASEALVLIQKDEYNAMVENEIIKKSASVREKDIYILKNKLMRFAYSRGYEQDIVEPIINKLIEKDIFE